MTNKFIYSKGRVIENFNYILPDDPYNDYIGNLIDFNNTIYEIVTDLSGNVLNPDDDAIIVSSDIEKIYDHIDYLNSKPLNISDLSDSNSSFQGDVIIEDGRIYYNGIEIIPLPDDGTNEVNTFVENNDTVDDSPTINYVDNRFF